MNHVGAESSYETILDKRIQGAMRRAREEARRLSDEDYANAVALVLGVEVSYEELQLLEHGQWRPSAALLWAAAQVAGQPVSSLLGEMKLYDTDLPALRRRLEALEGDAVPEPSLSVVSDQ